MHNYNEMNDELNVLIKLLKLHLHLSKIKQNSYISINNLI